MYISGSFFTLLVQLTVPSYHLKFLYIEEPFILHELQDLAFSSSLMSKGVSVSCFFFIMSVIHVAKLG